MNSWPPKECSKRVFLQILVKRHKAYHCHVSIHGALFMFLSIKVLFFCCTFWKMIQLKIEGEKRNGSNDQIENECP